MKKIVWMLCLLQISIVHANLPSWVNDMSKGCKKTEVCAVGEGDSKMQADINARSSLAKVFENQINSSFSSTLSSSNDTSSSMMEENIQELTNITLEGVEIKQRGEGKTSFYSLAVLNKQKTAKGIEREIKIIDDKLKTYSSDNSVRSTNQLRPLLNQREVLNKRFAFLTGREIESDIKFDEVFKKEKEVSKDLVLHIYLDEDEPKNIEAYIGQAFSDIGYKTTRGRVRNKQSTNTVTGSFIAEKMHLNVKGFEKYRFLLTLNAADTKGVAKGALTYEIEENGRDYRQATEKALSKIKDYIKDNIHQLNI